MDTDQLDPEIEQILSRDPAALYGQLDTRTRAGYHATVRFWANHSDVSATEISRRAIDMAASYARLHPGSSTAREHVGYYLVGPGATAMSAALRLRRSWRERIVRLVRVRPAVTYSALVTLLAAAFAAAVLSLAHAAGASWIIGGAFLTLGLPVYYEVASLLGRQVLIAFFPARALPRLTFRDGVPDEYATLIVIPTLLSSVARVRELMDRVQQLRHANVERNLSFALLSDFPDAPSQAMPNDAAILTEVERGIASLNAHRDASLPKVFLLHRERRWNPREAVWMGWERKRGKLHEMLAVLNGAERAAAFRWAFGGFDGVLRQPNGFRYMLVLDDDNWLEPGEAFDLIRTAAHPLNQVEYEPQSGRRVMGYGIFQPAVVVEPTPAQTPYALLTVGDLPPLPPKKFRGFVWDFHFDALDVGVFEGKGLYDVKAAWPRLQDAFPENRVLAHDYLEGFLVGAAHVGDSYIVQRPPTRFLPSVSQARRWIRGECQNITWILPFVRNARGEWRRNRIPWVCRCIAICRLADRFTEFSILALLIGGWTLFAKAPAIWTLLALLPLLLSLLILPLLKVVRIKLGGDAAAATVTSRVVWQIVNLQLVRLALALTLLAQKAALTLGEASRAIWRLSFSKRHLLEWTPQYEVDRQPAGSLAAYWRRMWSSTILGAGTLLAVALLAPANLFVATPFAAFWISSFYLMWCLEQPVPALAQQQQDAALVSSGLPTTQSER